VHIYWTAVCTRLLYFVKEEYKACIRLAYKEHHRHVACFAAKRGRKPDGTAVAMNRKGEKQRARRKDAKRGIKKETRHRHRDSVCVWGGGILGNKGDKHLLWRYEENFLGFQSAYKHLDKDEIP
jgi:hypothetical protein